MHLQRESLRRVAASGTVPRVASPEDLIVMKLNANHPKDHLDRQGLVALGGRSWAYVELRAAAWDVAAR
jgi:hypothetical protein